MLLLWFFTSTLKFIFSRVTPWPFWPKGGHSAGEGAWRGHELPDEMIMKTSLDEVIVLPDDGWTDIFEYATELNAKVSHGGRVTRAGGSRKRPDAGHQLTINGTNVLLVFDAVVAAARAAGYDLIELLPPEIRRGNLGRRESLQGSPGAAAELAPELAEVVPEGGAGLPPPGGGGGGGCHDAPVPGPPSRRRQIIRHPRPHEPAGPGPRGSRELLLQSPRQGDAPGQNRTLRHNAPRWLPGLGAAHSARAALEGVACVRAVQGPAALGLQPRQKRGVLLGSLVWLCWLRRQRRQWSANRAGLRSRDPRTVGSHRCKFELRAGSLRTYAFICFWIPFGDQPLKLERCREYYHGACARMTAQTEKCKQYVFTCFVTKFEVDIRSILASLFCVIVAGVINNMIYIV